MNAPAEPAALAAVDTPNPLDSPSLISLPTAVPPVLAPRRVCRQIQVGSVTVGGDARISVQSMTTTLTADVNATLQQIAQLRDRKRI